MTTFYKLGKKQRPIRFGYGAIYQFEKATNQSITLISKRFEKGEMFISDIIELIWAGYVNGCRSEKVKLNAHKEDVFDWLDEMPQETLAQIMQQFGESFTGGKQTDVNDDQDEIEEEEKK